MNIPALILDGIVLVTAAVLIVTSYRKGFLRTLVSTVGHLASCVVAFLGSRALAEACYRLFFRDRLIASVESAIEGAAAETDLTARMTQVMESLPGYLQAALSAMGIDGAALSEQVSGQMEDTAHAMSVTITGGVLYPIVYMLLQGIFFLVLFIACAILVQCLVKVLQGVERLPLIGTVNSLLGAVMGLVKALIVIFVATVAIRLVLDFTGGFSWLNGTVIGETRIFRYFYEFDLGAFPAMTA